MNVRNIIPSDIPFLKASAAASGFPYPEPGSSDLEFIKVVTDDEGKPLMAVGGKRLIELYLWCGEMTNPLAKVFALRLLHENVTTELKSRGYNQAEAFLPPSLSERFGRRLERTFNWKPNWPSWTKGF